jgi:hypothetical protein
MLAIARQRVPLSASFRRVSFLEADLPECAAVTAMGECFNFLFDQANSRETLVRFFGRVFRALRPGGVFVFDVAEPGRNGGPGRRQKHFQGGDWAVLVESEEDAEAGILTRQITTFRRVGVGTLYRRGEEVHRLRLYRGTELAAALRGLGFRVRLLRAYGTFRFPRGWVGIVGYKPPQR